MAGCLENSGRSESTPWGFLWAGERSFYPARPGPRLHPISPRCIISHPPQIPIKYIIFTDEKAKVWGDCEGRTPSGNLSATLCGFIPQSDNYSKSEQDWCQSLAASTLRPSRNAQAVTGSSKLCQDFLIPPFQSRTPYKHLATNPSVS